MWYEPDDYEGWYALDKGTAYVISTTDSTAPTPNPIGFIWQPEKLIETNRRRN